jgi:hypothetical protein
MREEKEVKTAKLTCVNARRGLRTREAQQLVPCVIHACAIRARSPRSTGIRCFATHPRMSRRTKEDGGKERGCRPPSA